MYEKQLIWINLSEPCAVGSRFRTTCINESITITDYFQAESRKYINIEDSVVIVGSSYQELRSVEPEYLLKNGDTIIVIPCTEVENLLLSGKVALNIEKFFRSLGVIW